MLLIQLIFIVTLWHMCEIYIKEDYYLFRWHIDVTGTKWIYLQLTTAIYTQNFKTIINTLYECIYIYMHFYKVFTCLFVLFYCGNKWGKYVYNMPWNNKQNRCLKNCCYLIYHLFLTHRWKTEPKWYPISQMLVILWNVNCVKILHYNFLMF